MQNPDLVGDWVNDSTRISAKSFQAYIQLIWAWRALGFNCRRPLCIIKCKSNPWKEFKVVKTKTWLVIPDYHHFPPTSTLPWPVPKTSRPVMLEAGFCHLVDRHKTSALISSGFQAKRTLQPVVLVLAIYELCLCEPDQNRMYCNSGHNDVGPLIHVVIVTWVEKAAAHVTNLLPY